MATLADLESEASRVYPLDHLNDWTQIRLAREKSAAHIRAKTVTAEQVEAAAENFAWSGPTKAPVYQGGRREILRERLSQSLRAAGFYVELDSDA